MTSLEFVTQLNALFARTPNQKYPLLMAQKIVKYFKHYAGYSLISLLDLISEQWTGTYGPPILGEILTILRLHNDRVSSDRAITAGNRKKQIPQNTEDYVNREELSVYWETMAKAIKLRDRKKRLALFKAAKERILDERKNSGKG